MYSKQKVKRRMDAFDAASNKKIGSVHNAEARSCVHCCSRKSICITYSECVFVALVIQHAMCMRHIVMCGLPGSTLFIYVISQTARFSKKKSF